MTTYSPQSVAPAATAPPRAAGRCRKPDAGVPPAGLPARMQPRRQRPGPGARLPALLLSLLLAGATAAIAPAAARAAPEGTTSDAALPETTPQATPDPQPGAAPGAAAADPAAERDPSRQCEVPPEVAPPQDPLPGLSGVMKAPTGPLTIVVLGSLSNRSKGETRGVEGFPARLQARLASRLAERGIGVPVKVEMVGRTRALAGELTALIKREVLPLKPALVIWQVGRADARKGNPPYRFSKGLAEGLDMLHRQGIDTILADIQYHPQFEALYRTDDYRNYVRWIAGERDLPLLRRYEMIEHWALSGLIDLDSANDADQKAGFEFIQDCIAYQAAQMIVGGAGLALR